MTWKRSITVVMAGSVVGVVVALVTRSVLAGMLGMAFSDVLFTKWIKAGGNTEG